MQDLPFTILIPTRDSARWISYFLQAYRRLGIEPCYVLDPRSTDETEQLLQSSGATYRRFEPRGAFIEAGTLAFAAEVVDKDWILRLDDDEFPSGKLLEWAVARGVKKKRAWGIPRLNLFAQGEKVYYSQNARVLDPHQGQLINNPQFRLYDKGAVEYKEALHTPGFTLKEWAYAPAEAHIVHFDALLKPASDRLEKVKRYEASRKGFGWVHSDQYLPEFFALEELEAEPYAGDLSQLVADLPVPERQDTILIRFDDIRQFFASKASQNTHAARLAFESRDDLASKVARALPPALTTVPVGEFVCTVGRLFGLVGLQAPFKALGSAIFERAMSFKSEAPQATAKTTGR